MNKYFITLVILVSIHISARSQYQDLIISKLLHTDTTSIGQKIVYPNVSDPEVTMLRITIPPGKSTGWHKHNFPAFAYVIKGILTVELEDHRIIKFKEGTTLAEIIDAYHIGTNMENSDLVILAIYLGGKGKVLSIPKEE